MCVCTCTIGKVRGFNSFDFSVVEYFNFRWLQHVTSPNHHRDIRNSRFLSVYPPETKEKRIVRTHKPTHIFKKCILNSLPRVSTCVPAHKFTHVWKIDPLFAKRWKTPNRTVRHPSIHQMDRNSHLQELTYVANSGDSLTKDTLFK